LNDMSVIHARCEDLANLGDYREKYDYSVSRAVSSLTTLMEYSVPFIKVGGKMLCYKGSNYQEEIDTCKNTFNILLSEIIDIKSYAVDEMDATRYLLVIKKNGSTPNKYPRGMNKPRLKPLN
ncbi:MAG: class I SAM-dependent methyltransferase, partial [Clostridia bacterium]|nr:class I SAM-dependent methyltransferase [Clostridia bacterium]